MAAKYPGAACLMDQHGYSLSYADLRRGLDRNVESLARLGYGRRDKVALLLPAGQSSVVTLLSTMSCSTCVPLDPETPLEDVKEVLARVGASALILPDQDRADAAHLAVSRGVAVLRVRAAGENPFLADLNGDPDAGPRKTPVEDDNGPVSTAGDDKALFLFTSGTSTAPKLVALTHRQLLASAANIAAAPGLLADDRQLSLMPLHHIHGLSTVLASLVSGGSIVCTQGVVEGAFTNCLQDLGVTWYSASPSVHRQLIGRQLREGGEALVDSRLRFVRSASEKMQPGLMREMESRLGVPVIEAYGMTEASPQIASNRLDARERKAGSVGRAAGPEIRIVDGHGTSLPCGTIGEIVIRGDNVITRYEDGNVDTHHSFTDGWLRTRDEGYLDEDGFLFLTGRLDDVINRGGFKIAPARVEQILNDHPAIAESTVFGVPDSRLGQEVSAAVVLRRGSAAGVFDAAGCSAHEQIIKALHDDLSRRLSRPELPKSYHVVEQLPAGPTGKRNRTVPTRSLALVVPETDRDHEADGQELPLSRTESRLVQIWKDVLSKNSFRASDNFFDIGGDSLSAAEVVHKVNEAFQAHLPANCLFDHPSISRLSRALGSHLSDSALERTQSAATTDFEDEAAGSRDGCPLSSVQKQIWFMQHDNVGAAYHMSASLYLVGELRTEALETAINEITRRHESLRIGIREEDGAATQFVRPAVDMRLEVVDLTDSPRSGRRNRVKALESEAHNEPFELSGEPLCRWKLVKVDQQEHLLLVILHHIISDAWSVNILYRELSSIYSSILARHEHAVGKPPPSFAAYARTLSHGASAKHEPDRYWERKLADSPEECRFPPDYPMPRSSNYKGATITGRINESLYRKVRSAARRCDVTPYVFLLAAFNALLFRYNAQPDSVVGTVVAGREPASTREMMGCFANTVVLRSDVSGETSFESYVRSMASEVRSTLEHADTSLMEIVRETGVHRQHGRNPIFQTMFVFQDFPHSPAGSIDGDSILTSSPRIAVEPDDLLIQHGFDIAEGLHAFPWRHDAVSTKFDLTLYLRPGRADLFLAWQFRTSVYEKETVQRIADHFNSLIEMVVDDASRSIGSYRLPRHRVPGADGNESPANRATPSRAASVIEQFRREVDRNPDAIAVIAGDRRWTYTELDRISNQVARYLRRSGVKPGDVAAILLDRRIELAALLIGVWKSGATYLPCDPAYPPGRIAHMLRSSNARLVLSDQEAGATFSRDLADGTGHIDLSIAWPAILEEPAHNLDDTGTEDTPAYIIYTSGSSGEPDKVVATRGNLAYYCSAMKEALQLSIDDRYLQTASISFSSSIRQLVVPLVGGSSMVLAGSRAIRNPEELIHLVCSLDATVVDLVPSHWSVIVRLLESSDPEHLAQWRNAPLRLMLSASESFPPALYTRLKVYAGGDTRIVNMYGQTETTGIVSMHWISDRDEARPAIPVGRPIPGTDIAILDERHQPVPIGAAGEVHVSSPAVTRHDLQLDGKQYYKTGDLARYLHDGSMEFVGRLDQRIKIRGHRVNPVEVESYIRLCAGIQDVVVEAVPAGDGGSAGAAATGGNQLAAFVIGTGDSTGRDESDAYRETRARIREHLPDYMVPSRFVELPRFPSLPNGKIDRSSLRRMAAEPSHRGETRAESESRPAHLLTPTERTIAALWKQFLKIDKVEKDDNFFELGGDSILSIRVVEQAREADIDISLEDLFQNQTLSSLAGCVDRKAKLDQQRSSSASDERPFATRLSADSLREFSIEALTTAGLKKEIAEVVTGVQLEASLRGQLTHNISSIPRYVRRIQAGKINAAPELSMIREGPNTAVISGDNGPGQWVAVEAMKLAMGKAREHGIGLVSVRQSNHFGAAGHYPWLAAREGLIGLCTTNGPVILAPTGGLTATLGNNPLAVGVPAGSYPPILLDITMSVASRGKIGVTLAEGRALPEGWIYDRHGRPSTNLADLAAGLGVPIGGHKGYGLALIMEVLAGVLSGSGFGLDHGREQIRQNSEAPDIGHFFLAVDPGLFMPGSEFRSRVDALIAQIKSGRRMDGVESILVPGERELTMRDIASERRVELLESEYQGLVRLGKQMKLKSKLEQV